MRLLMISIDAECAVCVGRNLNTVAACHNLDCPYGGCPSPQVSTTRTRLRRAVDRRGH